MTTNNSRKHAERVTNEVRELILSGDLPAGLRIGQEELASRFGVSRIPVRAALTRLENEGLITLKANSGAWVARLDLSECLEVYMIRERLEPLALLHSVPHFTDTEIDELSYLVERMAKGNNQEEFLRLDRKFHLQTYQAAELNYLKKLIERFWNTTQHYRRAFTAHLGQERIWIIHAEHRLLVDAIRRRDAEGAAQILREHIRRTRVELAANSQLFQ